MCTQEQLRNCYDTHQPYETARLLYAMRRYPVSVMTNFAKREELSLLMQKLRHAIMDKPAEFRDWDKWNIVREELEELLCIDRTSPLA